MEPQKGTRMEDQEPYGVKMEPLVIVKEEEDFYDPNENEHAELCNENTQPIAFESEKSEDSLAAIATDLQDLDDKIKTLMEDSGYFETTSGRNRKLKVCKVCGKVGVPADLIQHIEAKHITCTTPHICDVCGKLCKTRNALSVHKSRTHPKPKTDKVEKFVKKDRKTFNKPKKGEHHLMVPLPPPPSAQAIPGLLEALFPPSLLPPSTSPESLIEERLEEEYQTELEPEVLIKEEEEEQKEEEEQYEPGTLALPLIPSPSGEVVMSPTLYQRGNMRRSSGSLEEREMALTCEFCGRKFAKKGKKVRHVEATHLGLKPLMCAKCGESYSDRRVLEDHVRVVHDQRPYTCEEEDCGKTFGNQSNLTAHVRLVHLRERPFLCRDQECGMRFYRKPMMEAHMRAKHGLAKIDCTLCDAKFNRTKDLTKHMYRKHPYMVEKELMECTLCDAKFNRAQLLTKHMNKEHALMVEREGMEDGRGSSVMVVNLDITDPKSLLEDPS